MFRWKKARGGWGPTNAVAPDGGPVNVSFYSHFDEWWLFDTRSRGDHGDHVYRRGIVDDGSGIKAVKVAANAKLATLGYTT